MDYSHEPKADHGPYAVRISRQRHLPVGGWGTVGAAMVGHSNEGQDSVDYGVQLEVGSSRIRAFRCRWTDAGVTIVEPSRSGDGGRSIEHVVPAEVFLGGR